jgi:hypothetical protein
VGKRRVRHPEVAAGHPCPRAGQLYPNGRRMLRGARGRRSQVPCADERLRTDCLVLLRLMIPMADRGQIVGRSSFLCILSTRTCDRFEMEYIHTRRQMGAVVLCAREGTT